MGQLSTLLGNAQRQQADALDQLAADVRQAYEHHTQARGSGLMYAVEVGNLLRRAKRALPHGQFGAWIEAQKFGFERAWATVCIQASEAYEALIGNQIATQVAICEGYESVRDLAAARTLAKEGKDPLTVQRVPRPKVKRPKLSEEEAQAAYSEDVAAAANKTLDTRETELLAEIRSRDASINTLLASQEMLGESVPVIVAENEALKTRVAELEAENAALKARIAELEAKPKRATAKPPTEFQRFCAHPDVIEFRKLFGGGERAMFSESGRDADAAISACTRTVEQQRALMAKRAK